MAQLSESQYSVRRGDILALVNQLRSLGAQSDLDLPRIAVIGNQSAGKSSVVEAISGINVPRDAGTCTRCPMECRLSRSPAEWSCRVSIRYEYDAKQDKLPEVSEVPFGEVITDPGVVEIALRRAQLAILNPDLSHTQIFAATPKELLELSAQSLTSPTSLRFSKNVVCVDIEGPDLTDLAFIDLPGIIQNATEATVKLVEDMVIQHIQGECLILVALPMTDDIENQKAMMLARQADPTGIRTIGVMTKPDMLPSGSTKALQLWLDIIEGRAHNLNHGYYCTLQPNDDQRSKSISSADARAAEKLFFQITLPWSRSTQLQRFGTGNLIAALSRLLVSVIDKTLPKIEIKARESLDACLEELKNTPMAFEGDPGTYVQGLIAGFSDQVKIYVGGGADCGLLLHNNNKAYEALKVAIRRTAPIFVPHTTSSAPAQATDSDEDVEEEATTSSLNLRDMRERLARARTRQLPNNIPFDGKAEIMKEFQRTWESVTFACFEAVKRAMLQVLLDCIDVMFQRYELLRVQVRYWATELVEVRYTSCIPMFKVLLKMELAYPFTQNGHYLDECTEKWLGIYKGMRSGKEVTPSDHLERPAKRRRLNSPQPGATSPAPPQASNAVLPRGTAAMPAALNQSKEDIREELENETFALLARLGFHGVTSESLQKLNPPDEYETELKVMAEVRGYFQVTYKRIIDNIPNFIDNEFVKEIAVELQGFLISKFKLGAPTANDRCAHYLSEDPALIARRNELLGTKKRLTDVKQQLEAFGVSTK